MPLIFILLNIKVFAIPDTYIPVLLIVFLLFILIQYRDYKIVAIDDRLELFSIYRRRKIVYWSNISKIEIKKSYPSKLTGIIIVLVIYTNEFVYNFNINELDSKEAFMKYFINKCANLGITIDDLTSKGMLFYSQVCDLFNIVKMIRRKDK